VAVNKLDYDGLDNESYQFLSLGLGDPLGISAAAGRGIEELCQRLFHDLPADGFNIDHVLISALGVFAIETKEYTKPKPGGTKLSHGRTDVR